MKVNGVAADSRRTRVVRSAGPPVHASTFEQLDEVIIRLRGTLVARAAATLGDRGAAEDVVQEVLLNAVETLASGETLHDAARLLLHGTNARAHQRSRQAQRRQSVQLDAAAASLVADPDLLAEAAVFVEKARTRVSPAQWRVLTRKAGGWSVQDIAEDLGRREQTVKSALQRARASLRQLLEAWRGLLVLPLGRRLQTALRRGQAAVSELLAPAQGMALTLALGVVVVPGPSPASRVAPNRAEDLQGVVAVVSGALPAGRERQAVATLGKGSEATAPRAVPSRASSPDGAPPSTPLPLLGTGGETPEDTHIVDAAASPQYAEDHTLVALGVGQACSCPTLLRSTDGGATWAASTAALPYGAHVVLPPAFPTDPRIYVTNAPGGDVPDFVAAHFGASFVPLPMPPGELAVASAAFSDDTRLFVAALGHVWTYDIGPPSDILPAAPPTPVLDYPSSPAVATLSAPAGSADVFVMAPAGASPSGNLQATPTSTVVVYECSSATPCAALASRSVPLPEALLSSPHFATDHTLLARRGVSAAVSTDGGRSFTTLSLPRGAASVGAATLGLSAAGGLELWLGVAQSTGGYAVVHAPLGATRWTDASTHPLLRTSPAGALLAAGAVVVDVVSGHGLLCTASNGLTWSPRCSPPP